MENKNSVLVSENAKLLNNAVNAALNNDINVFYYIWDDAELRDHGEPLVLCVFPDDAGRPWSWLNTPSPSGEGGCLEVSVELDGEEFVLWNSDDDGDTVYINNCYRVLEKAKNV